MCMVLGGDQRAAVECLHRGEVGSAALWDRNHTGQNIYIFKEVNNYYLDCRIFFCWFFYCAHFHKIVVNHEIRFYVRFDILQLSSFDLWWHGQFVSWASPKRPCLWNQTHTLYNQDYLYWTETGKEGRHQYNLQMMSGIAQGSFWMTNTNKTTHKRRRVHTPTRTSFTMQSFSRPGELSKGTLLIFSYLHK